MMRPDVPHEVTQPDEFKPRVEEGNYRGKLIDIQAYVTISGRPCLQMAVEVKGQMLWQYMVCGEEDTDMPYPSARAMLDLKPFLVGKWFNVRIRHKMFADTMVIYIEPLINWASLSEKEQED